MSKPSKADRERMRARLAERLKVPLDLVWQDRGGGWWWRDPQWGPTYVRMEVRREVGSQ